MGVSESSGEKKKKPRKVNNPFTKSVKDINVLLGTVNPNWKITVNLCDTKELLFSVFFGTTEFETLTEIAELLTKKEAVQFLNGFYQALNIVNVSVMVNNGEVTEDVKNITGLPAINDVIPNTKNAVYKMISGPLEKKRKKLYYALSKMELVVVNTSIVGDAKEETKPE